MRLNKISLKQAVAMLAATCTLGTCCIAGSVAWADNETQGVNTATIDTGKKDTTSIIIHKYEGTAESTRSDGSDMTSKFSCANPVTQGTTKHCPIKGVKFKITRVRLKTGTDENAKKIDLSTSDGWAKINSADFTFAETTTATKKEYSAYDLMNGTTAKFEADSTFTVQEKDTDEKGTATFPNLPMGLYYVEETNVSDAEVKTTDGKLEKVSITKTVSPFFVTTPLANSSTKSWIYNVNVYPKNDTNKDFPTKTPEAKPSKDYIETSSAAGTQKTTMTWDITIPLNLLEPAKKFTTIKFTDPLMKDLEFDAANGISDVKISKFNATGTALTGADDFKVLTAGATNDYTVTADSNKEYNVDSTNKAKFTLVTVELTGNGLTKANTLYTSRGNNVLKLTAKITAKIKSGATEIVNVINTEVNNTVTGKKDDPKPCVPTKDNPCDKPGQAVTNFATLTATKINEEADKKKLKGAEFDVYSVKDGSTSTSDPDTNDGLTGTNSVFEKVNGVHLTTDDKGEASTQLFVGNGTTTSKKYCLLETKAPAGYDAATKPTCYNLTATTVADYANNNSKEIVNKLSTPMSKIVGALPMTGARGLVILTLCGIVGIASTFFYIVMKRRKEQEQE